MLTTGTATPTVQNLSYAWTATDNIASLT